VRITFITVSAPAIAHLIESEKEISEKFPHSLDLRLYYPISELTEAQKNKLKEDIAGSELVFADLMGSPPSTVQTVYQALDKFPGHIIPYGNSAREYLRLGDFSAASFSSGNKQGKMSMGAMKKMKGIADKMSGLMPKRIKDMQNYGLLMRFFKIADKHNMKNMLLLMLREYGDQKGLPKPDDPREANGVKLCAPDSFTLYKDFTAYRRRYPFSAEKPTVAVLFYGHTYPQDTFPCVKTLIGKISPLANVLPIAVSGPFADNEARLKQFLLGSAEHPVDLLINLMPFRLGAGPMGGDFRAGVQLLKAIDAPCLHPFFLSRKTILQWEGSTQGCGAAEILISVMLPELDGCIETYPIGAMGDTKFNAKFQVKTEELTMIDERLQRLLTRVEKHLALRRKVNKDKRVAVICYNYPPGESSLFGGAFLDTFASVETILGRLHREGYTAEALSQEKLLNVFSAGNAVNSATYSPVWSEMIRYPHKDYVLKADKGIHYAEMLKHWGPPPGAIMCDGDDFLIPGMISGNIFIGLQPTRGIHEQPEQVYHDQALPPHHQYLALYRWIREEFKADAVIHVGTHGTLEFLKGKECGISGDCYPDQLIGDIPHLYLYYAGNPAEAVIAKRRSYANLVGYQPPPFMQGGMDDVYSRLTSLISDYYQSLAISPQSSAELLEEIIKSAKELKLPEDLKSLEGELYRMQTGLIPRGLHIFGQGFDEKEAREYAGSLLCYSHGEIASLRESLAAARGIDLEGMFEKGDYKAVAALDKEAEQLFAEYLQTGKVSIALGAQHKKNVMDIMSYGKTVIEEAKKNDELAGLMRVLEGRYNAAKLAGDIYRNPEVLPTGYNLYQFDPRHIPTQTAMERGKRICQNTLAIYREESGKYPESAAVILWGLETSRTQGETFGQILSYLGVRIAPSRNEWDFKFEIIPIAELRRPRIDVVVNICGFFRDMFPNLLESLDDIFRQLYQLDESDEENYFKANTRKNYRRLLEEGFAEQEAASLAMARVFGPAEGEYGTGITGIVETKNWEEEEQIGSLFLERLQYVYTRQERGRKVEGLYRHNLKNVEFISQTRSSHEYEITDLDHYYEFFGGLAKSVEMVKGRSAKMYISDTAGERIYSEGVGDSISRGVRTRILNSKWIDGMLAHNYHGVQNIAKRFENILGLAATTNSVDSWIYDELFACYLRDESLREKLAHDNPHAYMKILEFMMEYYKRGYWQAGEEQIRELKDIYLQLEEDIEETLQKHNRDMNLMTPDWSYMQNW